MFQQFQKSFRITLGLAVIVTLVGCGSYFKKKDCEKTNWFMYGENISRGGGTIEGDKFVGECRKVEADIDEAKLDLGYKKGREEYCKPEYAFMLGKRGDNFKDFMCDGANVKELKRRHAEGITEYCGEKSGYAEGISGRMYQNVCPKKLEDKFLVQYHKGRIKYLEGVIASNESRIQDIEQEITRLEEDKRDAILKLAMTPQRQNIVREVRVDKRTGREVEQIRTEEDASSVNARDTIKREIDDADYRIKAKRTEQSNIKQEIQKHRAEIRAMEAAN